MANRRMFSLSIIDTDLFLDMPLSTQSLYFHLSMRADDDGFIGNPRKIQRMIGSSDDDLKLLTAKQFIIPFESGVCVIKHWRVHNYIQADRYTPTFHKLEKSTLVEENKTYEIMDTKCIQNVSTTDTQVRLGKGRLELGKDRLELDEENTPNGVSSSKLQPIIDKWNSLNLSKIISIQGNRLKMLNARIKEYGEENVLKAIDGISNSSFLKGQNSRSWVITFDWLIKPNNFPKVLEGNYIDKRGDNVGSARQNNETSENEFYDFSSYGG